MGILVAVPELMNRPATATYVARHNTQSVFTMKNEA
jgi:hypothetical protein